MAITTMDGLVAAIAGAQLYYTYEASLGAKAAGSFESLWTATGWPGAGSTPGTGAGAVPTNATAGAVPFVNPGGANTLYLARLGVTGATVGTVILYDRLVHTSGLSGTVITAQTVNSTALTRYTSGNGVQCWLEFYGATGSTGVTATISYTNSASTPVSGRSGTAAIPATTVIGQVIPMMLAAGDTGVTSVQSVTLSATTGTAGNFGITLASDLAMAPIQIANVAAPIADFGQLGLPIVLPNGCLAYRVLASTTSTGIIQTQLTLAQG